MSLNKLFIDELQTEAAKTRKMLERVPAELIETKPHEKNMTLGRLATHISELPSWVSMIMNTDELDFSTRAYKPHTAANSEEMIATLDENVKKGTEALENATDEDFEKTWTMRNGEHIIFSQPKKTVLRNFAFNHMVHHRGQLSIYLRLRDVPIPGMYGPSADEK